MVVRCSPKLVLMLAIMLVLPRRLSAVVCDVSKAVMPDDLYGVPDCVVAATGGQRHYLLRVGSATSHLQTDSSWCGDEREKACYLIGLEGQRPTCTYDNDRSGKIDKLKSLELIEAGLQAWPKKHDRRLSGRNAHLVAVDLFDTWPSSERRLVRAPLLNHASANPRLLAA